MTENLMKDIEEAIARGVVKRGVGAPRVEPQQYQTNPNTLQDAPIARDMTIPRKTHPVEWKGDMKFTRLMKYEALEWSLLIKQVEGHLAITTLHTQEFVRGHVIADDLGEPKYLIMRENSAAPTALLYTIKLDGNMFTEKQKTALKNEVRSKKITKLEKEVEGLKNEIEDSKNNLKTAEETIETLKTENKQLTKNLENCVFSKLSNKIKKLIT